MRAHDQKSEDFGCQSGPNQNVIQTTVVVFFSLRAERGSLQKQAGPEAVSHGIKLGAVFIPVNSEIQTVERSPEETGEEAEQGKIRGQTGEFPFSVEPLSIGKREFTRLTPNFQLVVPLSSSEYANFILFFKRFASAGA